MSGHKTLAEALVAVQAELPKIAKAETADTGKYTYSYADLPSITDALLPLLTVHGLSWTCAPTLDDQGRFVLEYRLTHTSGEQVGGGYPLPTGGTPQAQGSAITYARRYALCAVTGVAPDDDDDGAAAEAAARAPQVDLSTLHELIGGARARGIAGDYDALVAYASQSQGHAEKAVSQLRAKVAEHDTTDAAEAEPAEVPA